jgi:hypothetical protein
VTVAERMRSRAWWPARYIKGCPVISWRHRNLCGMGARVTVDGCHASVGGWGRIVTVYDGEPIGLIDLAQRAKAAARRLARKGKR